MEQSLVSVKDFTWDYAFLSSLPDLSREKATEIWLVKKDSDDLSDRNDLRCLYARILVQNIKRISKRYGWDDALLFGEFTIDEIERFCTNHDLSREFFWSDLDFEIKEAGRNLYVHIGKNRWVLEEQYNRICALLMESDEELEADTVIRSVRDETEADEEIVRAMFVTVRNARKKKKEDDEFIKLIEDRLFFKVAGLKEYIIMFAGALSKRDRKVLETYFGLRDGVIRTVKETAQELGVSEETVYFVLRKITPDRWFRDRNLNKYREDSSEEN